MKKVFAVVFAAFALVFGAKAQDFTPSWDLGVMGGVNYTTSNIWQISKFSHVNPNASISLGYAVSPWFGLRASLSGPSGNYPEGKNAVKFGYAQIGIDAMIDICNIFSYNPDRFFSPYLFIGGAGNYRFAVKGEDGYFGPGVRAGLGFNFRLTEKMALTLELQDNALNNKFNTLDDNKLFGGDVLGWKRPFPWDDNFAALIGLKFNL